MARVARSARARRVARGLTQRALAERAGVSLGSLRRFEQTGAISLTALVEIAQVLDALEGFDGLFPAVEQGRLEDVLRPRQVRGRVRG